MTDGPTMVGATRRGPRARRREGSAPAPTRLGDYDILGEIGRGGMGVVYRARQAGLDRLVAVKTIRDEALATELERDRFRVEARAAASLKHPNIVTVHEMGASEGRLFLCMELVDGPDLSRVIDRDGPFGATRAATFALVLARAVAHAHAAGILHRDLKPANVLLAADGQLKIADFGIATFLHGRPAGEDEGMAGSPGWLAPEQVDGRPAEHAPPTDVYGLGAVLYFLLTGRPPFDATSVTETLLQVVERAPIPPSVLGRAVPKDLEAICLRCLEKRPSRRYATALDLAADLERFLADEPVLARPRDVISLTRRWFIGHPLLVLTGMALTAFYVADVIAYRSFPDPDQASFHESVWAVLLGWGACAFLLETWLQRARSPALVHAAWASMEATFLTLLLLLGDGPRSAVTPVYALPIAAAALRARPWVVAHAAGACMAGYAIACVEAATRRPELAAHPQEILVELLTLASIGVVSFVVSRRLRGRSSRLASSWLAGLPSPDAEGA